VEDALKTVTFEDRGMKFVFAMPQSHKSMILNWSGSSATDIDAGSTRLFLVEELKTPWVVRTLFETVQRGINRFRLGAVTEEVLRALMPNDEAMAWLEEGMEALAIARLREQMVEDPAARNINSATWGATVAHTAAVPPQVMTPDQMRVQMVKKMRDDMAKNARKWLMKDAT
jgi:hypothetical protein